MPNPLPDHETRRLAAVLRRTRGMGRRAAEAFVERADPAALELLRRAAEALDDLDRLQQSFASAEPEEPLELPAAVD